MADDDDLKIMTDPSTQEHPAQSTDPNVRNPLTQPKEDKDPGETAPPVPETDPSKLDPYGNPTPMTPQEQMQHALEQYQKSQESINRLHARTAPMWEKYRAMLRQDQMQLEQQGPTRDQQTPPMPSQQKQTWLGAISQLLAVVVPIAMMFGIRGNGFAKGAMMSGIGSFMKNYAAGRDKAAKQDWEEWREQVQAIHQSNQERHQLYKDTLANKRLALQDQFQLINSYAQQFGDPTMARASRTNNMTAVIKHLQNQQKVMDRFERQAAKTAKVMHPTDWAEYRQYVIDETNGEIDPEVTRVGPVEAQKYNIQEYTEWHTKKPTTAMKTQEQKAAAAKAEAAKADPNAPMSQEEIDASREELFK